MSNIIKKLSTSQIIILGFAAVILLGSLILMLPLCTRENHWTSFIDALFTATSSVCVTGLVVHDTATYWSGPGQVIILCLIQIGGMGVITAALAIITVSGRKISLKQRSTVQEAISAPGVGGVVRLNWFIIRMVIFLELLGAALMTPVFCRQLGFWKGLWYSLFHSVSAFCNAGFDLMGIRSHYSSLTSFAGQPLINLTIMGLIVVGGIGFMTWDDIKVYKHHLRRYHMQSKVILTTTFLLILLPALYFYHYECAGLPGGTRLWTALFQAVTPRTAGFNTADLGSFSETGVFFIIMLMLIGGSPGSTAGGMKTTTFAVLISTTIAVFRKKDSTHFFGRRIPEEAIKNALTILIMYLVLFLTGGILICNLENLPLLTCLFESASAVGTVGLTLGITPGLGLFSKIILISLMFIGRVGGLTLVFSVFSFRKNQSPVRLPQEKITVG